MVGIDGTYIVEKTKKFILVGNSEIHKDFPTPRFSRSEVIYSDGIISRSAVGSSFVKIFEKSK